MEKFEELSNHAAKKEVIYDVCDVPMLQQIQPKSILILNEPIDLLYSSELSNLPTF